MDKDDLEAMLDEIMDRVLGPLNATLERLQEQRGVDVREAVRLYRAGIRPVPSHD